MYCPKGRRRRKRSEAEPANLASRAIESAWIRGGNWSAVGTSLPLARLGFR
ncbi:hypothetical protein MPS_5530 [Mycobacterium pseudoshottsii JCM 15466]|nr:hypothetical protein MMEU_2286 [Mycobacterium marinum str. Europe]GAQ41193.1 hypothetical protein MPS_5530 [Mycobacterium pseudoshottsii JCM 15466]